LLRDDERKTLRGLPGIASIPFLRALFGTDTQEDQTDIVMIITPRIVRSHQLTPDDLRDMFIGTGPNLGSSPSLPAGEGPPAAGGEQQGPDGPGPVAEADNAGPVPPTARDTVPAPNFPDPSVPGSVAGPVRIDLSSPSALPENSLEPGSGPHAIPITVSGGTQLTSITLTITYDPAIIVSPTVTQGSFIAQGGVAVAFVPEIDVAVGRIVLVASRPAGQGTTSGSGLLASIAFMAGTTGATDLVVSGTATSATGRPVPIEFRPPRVVVK
jgi:general secretion pathway protein D